jgi:hypothetical protein
MCHFLMPRYSCLLACAVVATTGTQVGFAAIPPTTVPSFTGKLAGEAPPPSEPLSLWYRQPATLWTSALPVGTGRQGAMMFGGIDSEVICLNEDTFWAGGPYTPDNPNAPKALPEVRRLLFDGRYRQAEGVISRNMMGRPPTQAPYQPVGDLLLTFPKVETAKDYRRDLNLRTATATVQFTSGGTTFTRELFASAPGNVLALRLTASRPGQIAPRIRSFSTERIPVSRVSPGRWYFRRGPRSSIQAVRSPRAPAKSRLPLKRPGARVLVASVVASAVVVVGVVVSLIRVPANIPWKVRTAPLS